MHKQLGTPNCPHGGQITTATPISMNMAPFWPAFTILSLVCLPTRLDDDDLIPPPRQDTIHDNIRHTPPPTSAYQPVTPPR